MPFEFEISGFVGNSSLAEQYGVDFPISVDSWTWDDWTEWDAQMTDADAGTYGTGRDRIINTSTCHKCIPTDSKSPLMTV